MQALLRVTGNASTCTDETMTPVATSLSSSLTPSPPVRHGFTIQSSPKRSKHISSSSVDANSNGNTSVTVSRPTTGLTIGNGRACSPKSTSLFNPSRDKSNDRQGSSSALDALATLASSAHEQNANGTMTSSSSDSDKMPPPPPRRKILVRKRSASNPEGMEKWDSYRADPNNRMHFVLPSTILEEELESANFACKEHERKVQLELGQENSHQFGLGHSMDTNMNTNVNIHHRNHKMSRPILRTAMTDFSIIAQPDVDKSNELYGTSPRTIIMSMPPVKSKGKALSSSSASSKRGPKKSKPPQQQEQAPKVESDLEEEEVIDESKLEPEELLRRARSKLFEDLSAENGGLEKGVMAFPHSLEKYKEIYNKNGRIGIYTPAERAAIIAKFNSKRTRRTWKKKIRYNCRKNLADRRMRVKGRFVKRAVEQTQNQKAVPAAVPDETVASMNTVEMLGHNLPVRARANSDASGNVDTPMHVHNVGLLVTPNESASDSADSSRTPSPVNQTLLTTVQEDVDMDMPDVEDPDAGFKPTASQPFRRTRRHTIT